jgi:cytochrome c
MSQGPGNWREYRASEVTEGCDPDGDDRWRLDAVGAWYRPRGHSAPEVFNQCSVCHSTDGSNGTGPTLKGLFGRQAGTILGFRYSRAMRGAGIVWDAKALDDYLRSPQDFIPGNVMPFSGLADSAERAGLIAYLRSLK